MVKATHNAWATGVERRRLYAIWREMNRRCSDQEHPDYPRYGGAGITVCAEWVSFENFLRSMGPRPNGKLSIDRIDGTKGYFPQNCRWASAIEQQRNKRTNHLLTWRGETRCLAEWAERLGIPRTLIRDRLKLGWSVGRALSSPPAAIRLKTECRNGHPRTAKNTASGRHGIFCKQCNQLAVARYKAKQKIQTGEQQ